MAIPFARPQVQSPPQQPQAPRMNKYENSGVLYENTSTHPKAPILKGVCTVGGQKYRTKIWRNVGVGKDGADVITQIFEPVEEESDG